LGGQVSAYSREGEENEHKMRLRSFGAKLGGAKSKETFQ